jgi:adenylate cyclase
VGLEIERKFLVKDMSWRLNAPCKKHLTQGYLTTEARCTVRIRQEVIEAEKKAWLTIKGRGSGIVRPEFEYAIPWEDGVAMLSILGEKEPLHKTRYFIEFSKKTWEIDEFHGSNEGLFIAEVNLNREDETVHLPPWVGKEVTSDSRYLNSNLYINPYKNWKKNEGQP